MIAMEKHRVDEGRTYFPMGGEKVILKLQSSDRREQFLLNLRRARIDLAKVTMQTRARQVVVLVRLDLGGAPHRNPDEQDVPPPHLHIYRQGFGDKWAVPVPAEIRVSDGLAATLKDFLAYCHVTQPPHIDWRLFA